MLESLDPGLKSESAIREAKDPEENLPCFSAYTSPFHHLICLRTKHHSAMAIIIQLAVATAPGTLLCLL